MVVLAIVLVVVAIVVIAGLYFFLARTTGPEPSASPTPEPLVELAPPPASLTLPTPAGAELYTHADGWSISLPPGWNAAEPATAGAAARFTPATPDAAGDESYTPTLVVALEPARPDTTLEAAVVAQKLRLGKLRDYTFIDDAAAPTANRLPAYILGGTYGQGPLALRNKVLLTVQSGQVVTVTGTALAAAWDPKNYNAVFDATLTSIVFP